VKKPDNLALIAAWEFFTAFAALVGIGIIVVFAFPDAISENLGAALPGAAVIFSISILVLICYIGIAIAGGVGLLKSREWGRVLSIVNAALILPSFPIGTAIGVIIIMYLTKAEVKGYFQAGGAGGE